MPNPFDIEFTHEPGKAFKNGQQVEHVARKLADGRVSVHDFPAIRVYRSGGVFPGQPAIEGLQGCRVDGHSSRVCEGPEQELLQAPQQLRWYAAVEVVAQSSTPIAQSSSMQWAQHRAEKVWSEILR